MDNSASEAGRTMAKTRWEKITPEERSKHGKKMVTAREEKKKLRGNT